MDAAPQHAGPLPGAPSYRCLPTIRGSKTPGTWTLSEKLREHAPIYADTKGKLAPVLWYRLWCADLIPVLNGKCSVVDLRRATLRLAADPKSQWVVSLLSISLLTGVAPHGQLLLLTLRLHGMLLTNLQGPLI